MGKVYLMKTDDSRYKIGVSKTPKKRKPQLQTGNPDIIETVCEYETDMPYKIETVLHNRFSAFKKHGEWYILSLKEEVEFLEMCKKIEENLKFLIENNNAFIEI